MSRAGYSRPPPTRYADEEEFEFDRRRSSRPPPDFLREDYGRNPDAGPVVLRERDKTVIDDESSYRGPERRGGDDHRRPIGDRRVREGERRRVEEDEVLVARPRRRTQSIRDNEGNGEEGQMLRRDRERERGEEEDSRTEILYRERRGGHREPSPRAIAREREEWTFAPSRHERPRAEKEDIVIRERDRAPPTPSSRDGFSEEIDYRHTDRESQRPRSAYHEDDFRFRERDGRGYRDEEVDFRERSRPAPAPAPSPPRSSWDEEITFRQRERERERPERERPRPRYEDEEEDIRFRERSRPGYRDEEVDIRERSRGPPPSRGGWDEEVDIREREKSRRGYREDEIDIRERERERERARPPPSVVHEDDVRIRDRSRPGYRDHEINIRERDREREPHREPVRERPRPPPAPPSTKGEEQEFEFRERDRRSGRDRELEFRTRSRSRKPAADRERELVIRRNSSPSPVQAPVARRPVSPPSEPEQDELVIKREQSRGGRREEIIIRRDRSRSKSKSPSPEREPTPPPAPAPREPEIVRAPTIHQDVITHHRHIDHGYEVRQPESRPESRPEPRAPSPPGAPRTVYDEEIDIRRRGDRDGRPYDDDVAIERKIREAPERSRARTPAPEPAPRERTPPPRPRSSLEVDIRRSGERGGDYYDEDIRLMQGVRSSRGMDERERQGAEIGMHGGPRYIGSRPREDKMWTEITKDLVIREALESRGYEVQETEHYFYVMEYLRYSDVRKLVILSDQMRQRRQERIREIEWERRHARPSPSPRPLPSPRPPPSAISERPRWDEERIYERDIYYDNGRRTVVSRPQPPPTPRSPALPPPGPPRREAEEVVVKIGR